MKSQTIRHAFPSLGLIVGIAALFLLRLRALQPARNHNHKMETILNKHLPSNSHLMNILNRRIITPAILQQQKNLHQVKEKTKWQRTKTKTVPLSFRSTGLN